MDLWSTNNNIPCNASGSVIEFSDVTFYNNGLAKWHSISAATLAGNKAYPYISGELYRDTTDVGSNKAGTKFTRFLPPINKCQMAIGGQYYPSNQAYDQLYKDPMIAYWLYKESVVQDSPHFVSYDSWWFRYCMMWFDYWGDTEKLF